MPFFDNGYGLYAVPRYGEIPTQADLKTSEEGVLQVAESMVSGVSLSIDNRLSASSENAIQNKVVTSALQEKLSLAGGTVTGVITRKTRCDVSVAPSSIIIDTVILVTDASGHPSFRIQHAQHTDGRRVLRIVGVTSSGTDNGVLAMYEDVDGTSRLMFNGKKVLTEA